MVGAVAVDVGDGDVRVAGRVLHAGEVITIDGATGEVFEGAVAGSTEVAPDVATLLAWAREAGIDIDGAPSHVAAPARGSGSIHPERVLRVIAIKGFVLLDGIADAVLSTTNDVQPVIDALIAEGIVVSSAGAFKLSDAGRARSDASIAEERAAWGVDPATAALDGFLDIDHRVKDVVTAWQMRDPQTVNDHSDTDHDADVLDRLAAIHADAVTWLEPLEPSLPRLADYRARLSRALDGARHGDGRYVASPRVDSYHGIWFELHEDLIQLAGRTREAEVAAGRA